MGRAAEQRLLAGRRPLDVQAKLWTVSTTRAPLAWAALMTPVIFELVQPLQPTVVEPSLFVFWRVAVGGRPDPEVGDGRELLPVEPCRAVGQLPVRQEAEDLALESARIDARPPGPRAHAPASPGLGRSAGPTAADGSAGGATGAAIGALAPSRIALPDSRPAGSAFGETPPTTQRSALRGLNGTVTRAPGAKAILSAAWAIASSYWTVGTIRPSGACGSAARRADGRRRRDPDQEQQTCGQRDQSWTRGAARTGWRRAVIDTRSLRVRGNAQPRVQRMVGLGLDGPGPE